LKDQTLQEGLHAYGVDGVDAAIDTTGKTMARKANLDALHQRGVLICVGHGEGLELEVSSDLIATERAVLGSEYFCYNEIATNLVHLQGNFDYLTQIITHRFGVEHLEEAYQLFLHDGRSGKVVIEQ
jgi:propanol-preferring alcohol dehydrogenase